MPSPSSSRNVDVNSRYLVVTSRGALILGAAVHLQWQTQGDAAKGKVDNLSLANARVMATLQMKQLRDGLDPIVRKEYQKQINN